VDPEEEKPDPFEEFLELDPELRDRLWDKEDAAWDTVEHLLLVHDSDEYSDRMLPEPSILLPGTEQKIEEMIARVERGESPTNRHQDCRDKLDVAKRIKVERNGAVLRAGIVRNKQLCPSKEPPPLNLHKSE
jgi:hypothetical protein